MGSQGEVGQGFSQLWPSLEACLAFFLYLCLSVVAGLEGLSHREHEARAFWHGFTFLGLSLSLSPIDFIGVEGLALEGRSGKLSQLKLWHYFEQGRLGKVPSAMVLLLAFLYMCLLFVAGVDGLFHKQHEERTLWHCFHFFSCLHYLLLISFGWKGWLFRGGPARFPQLWSYYSSFMFLSVVARVEGLSHKDHDATSFWHCVHSFGCLSLFCKLDATTVHEINPKRNPQMDAPKFCKRTPNTWLWGTPI